MLTKTEKEYITEHYVNWKPGRFRYWQSIPRYESIDSQEAKLAEESREKPALVFIHGYGAMIEHWREAFAGLRGRYRMYALDLLGFGFSEKLPGSKVKYSAELWARQIRDLLVHKGESKAILLGHSMGGMAAIQFARMYPDKIEGLVLVDSSGLPEQGKLEEEGARQQGRNRFNFGNLLFNAISAPGVGEMMALAMTSTEWAAKAGLVQAYKDRSKVTPQLVEQFQAPLRTPGAALSYLAVTRSFADFQLPIKPGDLTLPTLIIWGEFDKSMPPNLMLPKWQKLFPQAEVYLVKDAAHCPQDERPDLVNPQIAEFVEKLVAKSHEGAIA
jgi:pimeloyl-ACP methyl ester carboxylesterase